MMIVLLSVYRGRNFPKRLSHKLLVATRFQGEVLESDPLRCLPTPVFNTEFAWELDPADIKRLRGQRTALRLEVFLVDLYGKRESLGFLALDLRGAEHQLPAEAKYRPLTGNHTRSGSLRPELKLSFGIGSHSSPSSPQDVRLDERVLQALAPHESAAPASKVPPPSMLSSGLDATHSSPWHQFRFAIDIKSVRNVQLPSGNLYFAYNYNPTGTRSPVYTYPPVTITKPTSEALLPNSFCAFEFVLQPNRVLSYLTQYPLQLELWHRDTYEKDVRIGLLTIDISPLTRASRKRADNRKTTMRTHDAFYHVHWSPEAQPIFPQVIAKSPKFVLEVRVILALEDFGSLEDGGGPDDNSSVDLADLDLRQRRLENEFPLEEDAPVAAVWTASSQQEQERREDMRPLVAGVQDAPREDVLTRTASVPWDPIVSPAEEDPQEHAVREELELWRMEEEKGFWKRLHTLESDTRRRIVRIWEHRQEDAEKRSKVRLEELDALEGKVRTMLQDLSAREKTVYDASEQLRRKRESVESVHRTQMADLDMAWSRMKSELGHRLQSHKSMSEARAKQVRDITKEVRFLEEKLSKLRAEYEQAQQPEEGEEEKQKVVQRLQGSKDRVQKEIEHLRRRLEQEKMRKLSAKAGLAKAMKTLNEEKRERLVEREELLAKERSKLENTRLRSLFVQERSTMKQDREVLKSIRHELENLQNSRSLRSTVKERAQEEWSEESFTVAHNSRSKKMEQLPGRSASSKRLTKDIHRMVSERDNLLATGAYTTDDYLIQELNGRIHQLLRQQENAENPMSLEELEMYAT